MGRQACCALLSLIAVASARADGPNLLVNPGFEQGPSFGCASIGLYWDGPQDGCQPSVQALVSDEKHSGAWSQRLGPSTTTDFGWIRQVTNYNSIQTGKTYRIRAWIKSTVTDGWGWNVFRAEALGNDTTLFHINMPQQETPNYDWREISWEYEVTDPAVNRLGAALTRHWHNGFVWYDDVYIGEVTIGPPVIALSPGSITRNATIEKTLSPDSFTVTNTGGGTLAYIITDDAGWLSVSPAAGDSTGEPDTINVNYILAGLPVGVHHATITVSDPNASNSPQTVAVSITVRQPGDLDLDGDVDSSDFGTFQQCLSGSGVAQNLPECAYARMDGDVDVDQDDYEIFSSCMSGANVTADPFCAN